MLWRFFQIVKTRDRITIKIITKYCISNCTTSTAIENILLALPQAEPLQEFEPEDLSDPPHPINIGTIAEQYLLQSYGNQGDKTFGLKNKDGQFYLGKAKVDIYRNDLIVGDKNIKEHHLFGICFLWINPKLVLLQKKTREIMRKLS